jgi:hypothetical protein
MLLFNTHGGRTFMTIMDAPRGAHDEGRGLESEASLGTHHESDREESRKTDETKHATKTSEFWAYLGLIVGLVIAGSVGSGLGPNRIWLYLTILTVGYLVSRGLAKALHGRGRGNETKPSFKTTEFWVFLTALVALFITGLATGDGGVGEVDTLGADRVWLYAAILGVGYLVSRGLAKSGAGAQASVEHGRGGAPITERVKAAAEAFSGNQTGAGHTGRAGGV